MRFTLVTGLLLGFSGCVSESMLSKRPPEALLAELRPRGARALRLRGHALYRLGRIREARVELQISVALDSSSTLGHRWLGRVELALRNHGGALEHLERALGAAPRDPELRRWVAQLLQRRAHERRVLGRDRAARADQLRARALAPSVQAPSAQAASVRCERLTSTLDTEMPSGSRCEDALAMRHLRRLRKRRTTLACEGVPIARALERQGCLRAAHRIWSALAREAPNEASWSFALARVLLAQGRLEAASLALTDFVFLSPDRTGAELHSAELLLMADQRRRAGKHAVRALTRAQKKSQRRKALELLERAGYKEEARQAATLGAPQKRPEP